VTREWLPRYRCTIDSDGTQSHEIGARSVGEGPIFGDLRAIVTPNDFGLVRSWDPRSRFGLVPSWGHAALAEATPSHRYRADGVGRLSCH